MGCSPHVRDVRDGIPLIAHRRQKKDRAEHGLFDAAQSIYCKGEALVGMAISDSMSLVNHCGPP